MEVILDELTPMEFFSHGGIVKVTITDDGLIKECNLKKKYTFFEHKEYIRFFTKLYMSFMHNHVETQSAPIAIGIEKMSSYEAYKYVNSRIRLSPSIGKSEYVVDLNYDQVKSYEFAKFYYSGDKRETQIEPRDPYGIKNVCFSMIDETDSRWETYTKQRLERGFDSSELWNLDATIAKFIYPRLKVFAENADGCHPSDVTQEEWNDILKRMVNGFELLSSDRMKSDEEAQLEDDALDLFAQWFNGLWL